MSHFSNNIARAGQVVRVLARYGLADWLSNVNRDLAGRLLRSHDGRSLAEGSHEARIRRALIELGTTYIKLGQILSTRADLIGPELARELAALQTQTPADAPAVAAALIEKELSRPVAELFAEFDPIAFASGSIGQVHMARHHDGRRLVVKVQHAGIEPKIRNDLEILRGLAKLANQSSELRRYQPVVIVDEFQQTLLRELEFRREFRNLQQFRAHFAADPTVYFPEPIAELSSSRVLTMEFIDGVNFGDAAALAQLNADGNDLARRGANIYLEMIFRDGFYHADPHPGNIFLMRDGRIGMIDCGMVGRLDETLRDNVERLLAAIARQDSEQLTRIIMRLCAVPRTVDPSALAADVSDFLSYYGSLGLNQLQLGTALTEITDIIRRHELIMPGRVSLLIKVLVMLEGTSRLVSPTVNLIELIVPFQQRLIRRRLSPKRYKRKLQNLLLDWAHLSEKLPDAVSAVLDQLREGKFDVHLEHRRLQPSVNRLVFGLVTSALFVGSAMLWSSKAPPLIHNEISVFGVIGCAVSVFLAGWLLRSINKSGHLDSDE
jgi:ubiquinone biosynthesis protein